MRVIAELINHFFQIGRLSDAERMELAQQGFIPAYDRADALEDQFEERQRVVDAGLAGAWGDEPEDDARPRPVAKGPHGHEPARGTPALGTLLEELRAARRAGVLREPLRKIAGELGVVVHARHGAPQALRGRTPGELAEALASVLDRGPNEFPAMWPLMVDESHLAPDLPRRGQPMQAFEALVRTVEEDAHQTSYAWLLRAEVVVWALDLVWIQRVLRRGLLEIVHREPDRVGRWLCASRDDTIYATLVLLFSAMQDTEADAIYARYRHGHFPQRKVPLLEPEQNVIEALGAFDVVLALRFLGQPLGSRRILLTCPPSWDGASAPLTRRFHI